MNMPNKPKQTGISRRDIVATTVFLLLTVLLYLTPTGYESRVRKNSVRCKGRIVETNNEALQQLGIIRKGHQEVTVKLLNGPFKGETLEATNQLMGRMDLDKIYQVGDVALVVLSLDENGDIAFVNPQDHYRLGLEVLLLALFSGFLLIYGGFTGAKALLSFVLTALTIWKILVPLFLEGYDPVWLSLIVVTALSGVIIFLVGGINRKGLTAVLGAFCGVLTSGVLAIVFTRAFHVHGAVLPFAETMLYSGYAHLDLVKLYVAAVFIAASGAVMDLAMDVAASMNEVIETNPNISRISAIRSGFSVGRAVVGTMTTTLLFAYSGGYITLLMAFMAQGVPLVNLFNMIFVAAEVLKTLVGSFGLVTVAPFTAIVGAFVFKTGPEAPATESRPADTEAPVTAFLG